MKNRIVLFLFSLLVLASACQRTDKKNLVEVEKQELAKGIRNDSVFQGIYLGMTTEAFADTCRARHAEGLFDEGGNRMVEYELTHNELKFPAKISFFPLFKQNKISEVPINFKYSNLEIWNAAMKTDKLLVDVKKLMEKWYGDSFFLTPLPTGRNGFVQVSGNRRILIKVDKEDEVMVVFTDLTAQK